MSTEMAVNELIDEMFLDDTKVPGITRQIGKNVSDSEYKLVTVIEALGSRLTSKDTMERAKGMTILCSVLENLKEGTLTSDELGFVVEFLYDRLKDQHLVLPRVIHSIKAIIKDKNLPEGSAAKLMMQLFKEANIQSHIHKDRNAFFTILTYIVEEKLQEIKDWGSDFIMFFIQAMDGEKDPRNLLMLFRLVPKILVSFPMGPLVEDTFEVLSCYFPVDFTPAKSVGNEVPITREMLAQNLHTCLSTTNQFSQYLVPLAIEKLESNVVNAKLDSIELLKLCCDKCYTVRDIEPHLGALWRICRSEIFMGSSEAVTEGLYRLITSLFKVLSKEPESLEKHMKIIFNECKHHLMEPEMRLMQPASAILQSILEASEESAKLLLSWLLPLLYLQFLAKPGLSEKLSILMLMNKTILGSKEAWPKFHVLEIVPQNDEMVATIFGLLTHDNTGLRDLGLNFFSLVVPELDDKSLGVLYSHLLNLIQSEPSVPPLSTRKAICACLETVAIYNPTHTIESTWQQLKSIVTGPGATREKKDFVLDVIAQCFYFDEVIGTVLPVYLSILEIDSAALSSLIESTDALSPDTDTSSLTSISAVADSLLHLVENGTNENNDYMRERHDLKSERVIPVYSQKLVELSTLEALIVVGERVWKLSSCCSEQNVVISELCHHIYLASSKVVRVILRNCTSAIQQEVVEKEWAAGLSVSSVNEALDSKPVLLLASILGPLRTTVFITDVAKVMDHLLTRIKSNFNDRTGDEVSKVDAESCIEFYATLLNKSVEDDFSQQLVHLENIVDELKAETGTSNVFSKCDVLLAAFKAMLLRGASEFDHWLQQIVGLLSIHTVGSYIAEKFEDLFEDSTFLLNMESHCIYRFLYKQRLFLSCVPKLVALYKSSSSDDPARVNYIRSLSCQLRHVPNAVLRMELTNVLPLLVASLNCEDSTVAIRISSLEALLNLIEEHCEKHKPDDDNFVLKEYYHDIVPHLVRLAGFRNSLDVRVLALRCLRKCAKFPGYMVNQEKPKVVDTLKLVLDDPKRLVRREASTARNTWILMGAPGGY